MKTIFIFLSAFLASLLLQGQTVLHYDFTNSLSEKNGAGPELTVLGNTGSFLEETLNEVEDAKKWVYRFEKNSGFQFDNTAAGNFLGEDYSIGIYFVFDELTSWKRVVDWKNRKSDYGAYVYNGKLNFYNIATSGEAPVVAGEYTYYVITRKADSKEVKVYTDAEVEISFTDDSNHALLDEDNVLNFFHDDLIVPNEASPGAVAMIKLYNYALDSTTISNNFDDLAGNIFYIGELKKLNTAIKYFPNPANQQLNIDLSNFEQQQNIRIKLIDTFGRTILEQETTNDDNLFLMNLAGIQEGVYVLFAESDSKQASSKVMIKH